MSLTGVPAEKVLIPVIRSLAEKHLCGIVNFKRLKMENMRPVITVTLEGLDDKEFTARVGRIDIAEDGRSITLGDFTSNYPFLENALNRFATSRIDVGADNAAIQMALKGARKFFA